MKAETLITGITQLVSPQGADAKHGSAMSDLICIRDAAIAIDNGRFLWLGKAEDWRGEAVSTVDVSGRAVVPGLVDPHTHAVWAGDRLADFELRTSGSTYEQILAAGGGIRSTIKATQAASREELVALAVPRLNALLDSGATTIEVKSGYGFTPDAEIVMLEAIRHLQRRSCCTTCSDSADPHTSRGRKRASGVFVTGARRIDSRGSESRSGEGSRYFCRARSMAR